MLISLARLPENPFCILGYITCNGPGQSICLILQPKLFSIVSVFVLSVLLMKEIGDFCPWIIDFFYHEVAVLFLMGHVHEVYSNASSETFWKSQQVLGTADLCFNSSNYLIHVFQVVHLVPCEGGESWQKEKTINFQPQFNKATSLHNDL